MNHLTSSSLLRCISYPKGRTAAAGLLCIVFCTATKVSNLQWINDNFSSAEQQQQQQHQLLTSSDANTDIYTSLRKNCQIVYVLGVEGSIHHGVTPIIDTLARQQIDPYTGNPYTVHLQPRVLRAALFGIRERRRSMTDPSLIQEVLDQLCPRDGNKHVIIEDSSFPCGAEDDPRSYRVHRQREWMGMTMQEIAQAELALNHPTNLQSFVDVYSPHAEIKFVVLHRPFLETVASHTDVDEGSYGHSNVIRGFMLILRRFLDANPRLWTMVCVERLMSTYYEQNDVVDEDHFSLARQNIVSYMAVFLGWPQMECPHCFDSWQESTKDAVKVLGEEKIMTLLDHMKELEGVWPPVVVDEALPEQHCST
jgi:hypothetical protein